MGPGENIFLERKRVRQGEKSLAWKKEFDLGKELDSRHSIQQDMDKGKESWTGEGKVDKRKKRRTG